MECFRRAWAIFLGVSLKNAFTASRALIRSSLKLSEIRIARNKIRQDLFKMSALSFLSNKSHNTLKLHFFLFRQLNGKISNPDIKQKIKENRNQCFGVFFFVQPNLITLTFVLNLLLCFRCWVHFSFRLIKKAMINCFRFEIQACISSIY